MMIISSVIRSIEFATLGIYEWDPFYFRNKYSEWEYFGLDTFADYFNNMRACENLKMMLFSVIRSIKFETLGISEWDPYYFRSKYSEWETLYSHFPRLIQQQWHLWKLEEDVFQCMYVERIWDARHIRVIYLYFWSKYCDGEMLDSHFKEYFNHNGTC